MHYACRECDFELIKNYMYQTILNDSKDLTLKIDQTSKTASLIKLNWEQVHLHRNKKKKKKL